MPFITFEGIDGAGKTTQVARIAEHLSRRGYDVMTTKEPGATDTGRKIEYILRSQNLSAETQLYLYMADREQHAKEVLRPTMKEDPQKIILCDRYYDSTFAYQGYWQGLDLYFIDRLNLIVDVVPDLTFLLDIPERTGFIRKHDWVDYDESMASAVRNGFLARAKHYPSRIRVIDAEQSVEEVTRNILKRLEEYIMEN